MCFDDGYRDSGALGLGNMCGRMRATGKHMDRSFGGLARRSHETECMETGRGEGRFSIPPSRIYSIAFDIADSLRPVVWPFLL